MLTKNILIYCGIIIIWVLLHVFLLNDSLVKITDKKTMDATTMQRRTTKDEILKNNDNNEKPQQLILPPPPSSSFSSLPKINNHNDKEKEKEKENLQNTDIPIITGEKIRSQSPRHATNSLVSRLSQTTEAIIDADRNNVTKTYDYGPISPNFRSECLPPIIVGGSAGSATRTVVSLLMNLGSFFLVDNGGTLDIEVGDWPRLVSMVLSQTNGTPNYKLDDLDPEVRRMVKEQLLSMFLSRNISCILPHRGFGHFGLRTWGFKAPATIFFLPFWKEIFPGFVFIHSIRDGRDHGWGNLGDEKKHFFDLYPEEKNNPVTISQSLQSVRTWLKVNRDGRLSALENVDPGRYHIIQTEHLVSKASFFAEARRLFPILLWQSNSQNNYNNSYSYVEETWKKYSPLKDYLEYACCAAGKLLVKKVSHGRWRQYSRSDPLMFANILEAADEGLELFGYKLSEDKFTQRSIEYMTNYSTSCKSYYDQIRYDPTSATTPTCRSYNPIDPTVARNGFQNIEYLGNVQGCSRTDNVDRSGGDITAFRALTFEACCNSCTVSYPICTHFAYYQSQCFLKNGKYFTSDIKQKHGVKFGALNIVEGIPSPSNKNNNNTNK